MIHKIGTIYKNNSKRILRLFAGLVIIALLVVGVPFWIAGSEAGPHLFSEKAVPAARVAIVFGAGLQRDGTPSAVLRDRVEMAVKLYKDGKIEKILMSGDNRFVEYNEPGAMRDYAVGLGVPASDIVLDYAGRRTYDTCYRARFIFDVKQAILVTQQFHLTRAIFTCSNLGIDSSGVPADHRTFRRSTMAIWEAREIMATSVALWQVWIERPLPVLGQPEPIFPDRSALQNAPDQTMASKVQP